MAALADTNVLVYRYDSRFPDKQARAEEILRDGIAGGSVRIAHQAIVEFVSATTKPIEGGRSILEPGDAHREAEEFLAVFPVVYPNEEVVRTALRGSALYALPWFDAHMWAFAEVYGMEELISEDFQPDRLYGRVRIVNPF